MTWVTVAKAGVRCRNPPMVVVSSPHHEPPVAIRQRHLPSCWRLQFKAGMWERIPARVEDLTRTLAGGRRNGDRDALAEGLTRNVPSPTLKLPAWTAT